MGLNVLIVDDERGFRRYLTNAVVWKEYDLTVVAAVGVLERQRGD